VQAVAFWRRTTVELMAASAALWGQTQVDLRTQSRAVDFSAAPSMKPAETAISLPVGDSLGPALFLTTPQPRANWYLDSATNIRLLLGWRGGSVVNNAIMGDGASQDLMVTVPESR